MNQNIFTREIEKSFSVRFNKNQTREISRLLYEIEKITPCSSQNIINQIKKSFGDKKIQNNDLFSRIKKSLIHIRYPLTSARQEIKSDSLFLNAISESHQNSYHPKKPFIPEQIFIEQNAKDSFLAHRAKDYFPKIPIIYVNQIAPLRKELTFNSENLKKPLLFIVKEIWDFFKPCPCTKQHIRCGYFILNLGFGCPFDCSYCYLQHYQNFPGIILPANMNDFIRRTAGVLKNQKTAIRIGTGEFCDSLALDSFTLYSRELIRFFAKQNVFFELKTKSACIENIITEKPSKNIVISWSVNPEFFVIREELSTAPLAERINAAQIVQNHGFSIGFHFDPIIYFSGWQEAYQRVIEKIYLNLRPPFAWISLGTLRFHRDLKGIIEKRFPGSRIEYGELLLGKDKKMRYPDFLRVEMYRHMIKIIRAYDAKTPLYLCMETESVWRECFPSQKFNPSSIPRLLTQENG